MLCVKIVQPHAQNALCALMPMGFGRRSLDLQDCSLVRQQRCLLRTCSGSCHISSAWAFLCIDGRISLQRSSREEFYTIYWGLPRFKQYELNTTSNLRILLGIGIAHAGQFSGQNVRFSRYRRFLQVIQYFHADNSERKLHLSYDYTFVNSSVPDLACSINTLD